MIRRELAGMLPAVIEKVEELLASASALNPVVVSGYDATRDEDSLAHWGVACRITSDKPAALKTKATALGFLWLSGNGDVAYTNGLTIDDFKTFRVNGELELTPEKKEEV